MQQVVDAGALRVVYQQMKDSDEQETREASVFDAGIVPAIARAFGPRDNHMEAARAIRNICVGGATGHVHAVVQVGCLTGLVEQISPEKPEIAALGVVGRMEALYTSLTVQTAFSLPARRTARSVSDTLRAY
eukprot:gene28948-29383_t